MGLLRTVGKMARGAADTANSVLPEIMRQQALAERDARLREYEVEDRDIARTDAENKADIDRYEADYQAEKQREFLSRNDADQKKLLEKQIAQIDQEIEIGGYSVDAAKDLNDARKKMVDAKTPEERAEAYTLFLNLQGKDNDPKYQATTLYGEENEFGVQQRATGILNQSTGEIAPATMGGTTPPSANGGIPQEAIQELQANPTQEMKQFFDQTFGAGASDRALGGSDTPPAVDTQPAPGQDPSAMTDKPQGLINMEPIEVTAQRKPVVPDRKNLPDIHLAKENTGPNPNNLLTVIERNKQANAEKGRQLLSELSQAPRKLKQFEKDQIRLAIEQGLIPEPQISQAKQLLEKYG